MNRRRLTRRSRKKIRKVIAISAICLLGLMTAGYAAMQTNLNINAKGNILQGEVDITNNVVTNGDGLYIDTYEEGRYVYKGANPNNYIEFNNELWRIISKEADGTYKIVRNEFLANQAWHTASRCSTAYNNTVKKGKTYIIKNITYLAPDVGYGCFVWTDPATLNTYLNGEYYNNLNQTAKNSITSHSWKIGGYSDNNRNDLRKIITDEGSSTWNGNIGLINTSDYLRANSDIINCNANNDYSVCKNTNWLYNNNDWWTINTYYYSSIIGITYITSDGDITYTGSVATSIAPRPTLYLSSDITLTGKGTKEEPYHIKN